MSKFHRIFRFGFASAIVLAFAAFCGMAGCTGGGGDDAEPEDATRPLSDFPLQENPPDSWTQYAGNAAHDTFLGGRLTGVSHVGELTKKPIFGNYNDVRGGMSLADGTLFAPDDTGRLLAIDADTGAIKWRSRQLDYGSRFSTPTYHRGLLFCGTEPGGVTCLNAETGGAIWHQSEPQGLPGVNVCPIVAGASVLFSSRDGRFFRLDAMTGALLWSKELVKTEINDADPVIDSGTAVFPTRSGYVYGLSPDFGTVKWAAALFMGVASSPVAKAGRVYFTGIDAGLYGMDAATGDVVLKYDMSAPSGMTPLVNGNMIVAADEENYLYCVNIETAELIWKAELPTPAGAIVFGFDNAILTVATINERIFDIEIQRARGRLEDFLRRKGPFLAITREDLSASTAAGEDDEVAPRPMTGEQLMSANREDIAMLWARRAEVIVLGWNGEIRERLALPAALSSSPVYYRGKIFAPDLNGSVQVVKLDIE